MGKSFRVLCPECCDAVEHHCHTDLRKAVVDFLSWVPETGLATKALEKAFFAAAKEYGWGAEPDTFEQPFFGSQAWSYVLFGSKETARSFHSEISAMIRAMGFDESAIQEEIYAKRERRKVEKAAHEAAVQKRRDEKAQLIAFLQSDAPLEERIVKLDEILLKFSPGLKPYGDKHDGFEHLHDTLKRYYGGGISHEVNTARIKKLEAETFDARRDLEDEPEELSREVRMSIGDMRALGSMLRRAYGKSYEDPRAREALRKALFGAE